MWYYFCLDTLTCVISHPQAPAKDFQFKEEADVVGNVERRIKPLQHSTANAQVVSIPGRIKVQPFFVVAFQLFTPPALKKVATVEH